MNVEDIIKKGEETNEKLAKQIKHAVVEASVNVNKHLSSRGIDVQKVKTSLVNDTKKAANFSVGAAKIIGDKIKNKIAPQKDERTLDEIKQEAINKIHAYQKAMKEASAAESTEVDNIVNTNPVNEQTENGIEN